MSTAAHAPIAIMGLSADPPHKGHLKVAEAVHNLGYQRVILMVTPQNPFKKTANTAFEHRIALTRMLVGRRTWLELSDAEAWMQIYGETLRTHGMLAHLRNIYPHTPFTFVMGADNWLHFHEWGKYKDILDLASILIIPRPGSLRMEDYPASKTLAKRQDMSGEGVVSPGCWRVLPDIPGGAASSTQIRRDVAANRPNKWLLPEQANYIRRFKLYV